MQLLIVSILPNKDHAGHASVVIVAKVSLTLNSRVLLPRIFRVEEHSAIRVGGVLSRIPPSHLFPKYPADTAGIPTQVGEGSVSLSRNMHTFQRPIIIRFR